MMNIVMLDQPDVRLLTLTGPPGVGKTRLAQHIAETIQYGFTDGFYTVSLAPLRDHSLVASAIAQTVGTKESAHQAIHEALVQTLKDQKVLLLLDNFEHVLEAASLIAELITIIPDLTILVTSRTPLRIVGEQEYPVPTLNAPDSIIPASLDMLSHNPTLAVNSWIDLADTQIEWLPVAARSAQLHWRGMPVDERIVFRPETITAEEVLNERNAERRRVMLERMGYEAFLEQANAEVLDHDSDPGGERRLLKVAMTGDEDLVCVSVICPSTGRQYLIRVPPQTRTCHQAAAWIAGFDDPNAYQPIAET